MSDRKNLVAGEILAKFNDWQEKRQERQEKWKRYSRIARLQEDTADRSRGSEKSTLKMPTTKSTITMALDHLYQMLLGTDRFFDIKGRTMADNAKANILRKYLEYLLGKSMFRQRFKLFLYDLCAYGTGICRVSVETGTDKRIKLAQNADFLTRLKDLLAGSRFNGTQLENGGFAEDRLVMENTQINRPQFEWINIFDFFIEPNARSIQESEGVIVRKIQKIYRLRQLEAQGLISGVGMIEKSSAMPMDHDRRSMLAKAGINAELGPDDVTIFEYWGWLDEELLEATGYEGEIKNGGAEVYAEVANGQIVLKLIPNPFLTGERPFFKENFEEIPGEFYGLGICDIADGPQRALDATVRCRIDNKRIAINQVFAVDINRLSVDETGKVFPSKTFFTEGNPRDIIQQLDIRDVTSGSYVEAQEFERYIHEGTGVSPILAGFTGSKKQSATEANIAQAQSSVRLKMVAMQIEQNVTTEVLRWFYQIALQFLETEEIIHITNEDIFEAPAVSITREAIVGDYDFIPIGVMNITTRNNYTKIMDFLARTANQFDIQVTNRAYLLRKAYEALGFSPEDAEIVFNAANPQGTQMVQNAVGVKGVSSAPVSKNRSEFDKSLAI